MKPAAIIEFRVKLVLVAVILGFLLWVTNGRAGETVTTIKLDWAYYNPLSLVRAMQTVLGNPWWPELPPTQKVRRTPLDPQSSRG